MMPKTNKLCRTCLTTEKDLISIYEEVESPNDSCRYFANIIGNLTNNEPKKMDGLPELVCLPCSKELKKIEFFKMQCINSECILRKTISLRLNDKEHTNFSNDKAAEESLVFENENQNQEMSSAPPGFVIIKCEEPACSSLAEQSEIDEKPMYDVVNEVDHSFVDQTYPMEVIVKEEPGISDWSDQMHEPKIKEEVLTEPDTDLNEEEPIISEQCTQNRLSDVEPELRETTTNDTSLENHQGNDKKSKSKLTCPNCQKSFMHLARLKRHIKTKTCVGHVPSNEKQVFACLICGKKYNRQFSLQRHSLVSHQQKLTKEIITETKEAHQEPNINNSQGVHSQVKLEVSPSQTKDNEVKSIEAMRQCNICKDIFENEEALADHKILARHKKLHHTEKAHICNICNKAFSFSHNLKIHLMNHKEIKPFKCEQCNQRFVRNSCLTRHLKTHTGDRPFTCEFCNKGFPYMYALKIHERSHTDERPYSCTTCSMRFKFPYTLKEHQRTHTGEKPYACKLCPRRLSSKNNFRIHMRNHEKQNRISVPDSEKLPAVDAI